MADTPSQHGIGSSASSVGPNLSSPVIRLRLPLQSRASSRRRSTRAQPACAPEGACGRRTSCKDGVVQGYARSTDVGCRSMRFFAYISRAKVDQLHHQITDVAVEHKTVTRKRERHISGEASTNPLLGAFKLGAKGGAGWGDDVQEVGSPSVVHRLTELLAHIDDNETVLDLGRAIDEQAGVKLDAFCYFYSGAFRVLGQFGRQRGYSADLRINVRGTRASIWRHCHL